MAESKNNGWSVFEEKFSEEVVNQIIEILKNHFDLKTDEECYLFFEGWCVCKILHDIEDCEKGLRNLTDNNGIRASIKKPGDLERLKELQKDNSESEDLSIEKRLIFYEQFKEYFKEIGKTRDIIDQRRSQEQS